MGGRVRRTVAVAVVGLVLALAPATSGSADTGLHVSVSKARLTPQRTSVVLTGTYSCGPFASGRADRGVVDLTVEQARPNGPVRAFGFLEPTICDGTPQAFSATVTGVDDRRFRAGVAQWSASGYVEGDTGTQTVFVPPTSIRLRLPG